MNDVKEVLFTAISADGTPIRCAVDGSGPALVMIHGTGDTYKGFRRLKEHLAPHFTLYMMDRRGRGISGDGDDAKYELAREFEDVATVIDTLAKDRGGPVNVFAHSFGAMCALEGALLAHNLRRMVCYEPSLNRTAADPKRDATIDEMRRLIAAGDRDATVAAHLRGIINTSEETIAKQRAIPDAWAARMAMAHTMPRELTALKSHIFEPERYSPIAVPVRFLLGEKSVGRGPENAQRLVAAIPGAELVMLEGQGHFGYLTAPDLVAAKIVEFLAE
jgi:pimeloyl-ACP methyl ester carboxylesterase